MRPIAHAASRRRDRASPLPSTHALAQPRTVDHGADGRSPSRAQETDGGGGDTAADADRAAEVSVRHNRWHASRACYE